LSGSWSPFDEIATKTRPGSLPRATRPMCCTKEAALWPDCMTIIPVRKVTPISTLLVVTRPNREAGTEVAIELSSVLLIAKRSSSNGRLFDRGRAAQIIGIIGVPGRRLTRPLLKN
jgi:hypothetical protein